MIFNQLLYILGIPNKNTIQGKSLTSFLNGNEKKDRSVFSESTLTRTYAHYYLKSVQLDGFKYILSPVETTPKAYNYDFIDFGELYNIKDDPEEKTNLNAKGNKIADKLKKELGSIAETTKKIRHQLLKGDKNNSGKRARPTDETKERLKALGYLQ